MSYPLSHTNIHTQISKGTTEIIFELKKCLVRKCVHNISVISWRSALLVEEIVVPGENHRPVASH
jgi:hypothetical protein